MNSDMSTKTKAAWIFAVAAAALMLSGCSSTPRGLQHVPSDPAVVQDPVQSAEARSFAAAAGSLEAGASAVIQPTPIGTAQATVQSTYMNALGEQCKKILLKTQNAEAVCGVCLGKDNVWRYVPALQ